MRRTPAAGRGTDDARPGAAPGGTDPGTTDPGATGHVGTTDPGAGRAGTPVAPAAATRRRQWGAERPRRPLPMVEAASPSRLTWLGGLAVAVTVTAWVVYLGATIVARVVDHGLGDAAFLAQMLAYVLLMSLLLFSSSMYLLARQGALYRSRDHVRAPRAEVDALVATTRPTLTVLVPSYAEEPAVVRMTLLSAALQEYPDLRLVLLLDDPPHPTDPAAADSLAACRALPGEIEELLAEPATRFRAALAELEASAARRPAAPVEDVRALADHFAWAAAWLRDLAAGLPHADHVDEFVATEVVGGLADDLAFTGAALAAAVHEQAPVPAERLVQLCRRLVWTFGVEASAFERKRYANLPHDANKAMNLNAYLGLMGSHVVEVDTRIGRVLRRSDAPDARLVPASDYVLTLDADSVLLREYCLRLVHQMELPGNERVAVIQTPYSAFRGAPTRLERIAGATTDIQHLVHQGLTYFDATFWVGANAVIRTAALQDIVEVGYVHGEEVRRYVQDRTVIEDTESSIDLVAHGWTLVNYPERLSYSATPPDFGSLVVQRARWANGGLLILPKFWRYARRARREGRPVRPFGAALRTTYMASTGWATIGLLVLLVFPFDDRLLSPVVVLAALPYFVAMASDFRRLGYKRTDVLRIYAFNLVLLPVNLAGTLTSLQQAATKSKIPFARTPKVAGRTAAPATYVLAAVLIALFSWYSFAGAVLAGSWSRAAFAAFNGLLTTYGIVAFIGLRHAAVDVVLGAVRWVRVPRRVPRAQPSPEELVASAWESVLYLGPDLREHPRAVVPVSSGRPERRGDTRARQR